MSSFNIRDSHIEQLNEEGDNLKLVGGSGPTSLIQGEQVAQSFGAHSNLKVAEQKNLLKQAWDSLKLFVSWLWGKPTGN